MATAHVSPQCQTGLNGHKFTRDIMISPSTASPYPDLPDNVCLARPFSFYLGKFVVLGNLTFHRSGVKGSGEVRGNARMVFIQ